MALSSIRPLIASLLLVLSVAGMSPDLSVPIAEATLSPRMLEATITLSRTFGPPTSTVGVRGRGFGPVEIVEVSVDAEIVGTAMTDDAGAFSARIRIPGDALPGEHTVSATGEDSGLTASATFLVRTDWRRFHFDMQGRGHNPYENVLGPSNVSGLQVRWVSPVVGAGPSSPAVVGGVVYTGALDGRIYAVEAETGVILWSYSTGDPIYGGLAVVAGVVYVGSNSGDVFALDAATGAVLWRVSTDGAVQSSPAVGNGVVYVGSSDANVYALDADTGVILWKTPTGGTVYTSPAVAKGTVYAASYSTGTVHALDAMTGAIEWTYTIGNLVYGGPAVDRGLVFVGSNDSNVYALDAEDGHVVWSTSTGGYVVGTPAVARGTVFVGSLVGAVMALDAATGEVLWRQGVGTVGAAPSVANGVVYAPACTASDDTCYDAVFVALDAADGRVLRTLDIPPSDSSPAISDGVVYLGAGSLYAFSLG